MLDPIQSTLERDCQILPDKPILVGVSGGADSLCLLDILIRLGYSVLVAHFNHLLRPEASDDARAVEGIAGMLKVPLVLGEGSTNDYAQEHNLSIEEAARNLRYRFLFERAEIHDAQAVAVAHNADDQVETVLMHLLRGAGLDGLTGMSYRALPNPWSETIPLVRPLLGVWRNEIEAYCTERELDPAIDCSNIDITFFRNRLRHELIPQLDTYVPGFRARLWQTADLLTADRGVLEEITDKAWQDTTEQIGVGYLTVNHSAFSLQPLGVQRRLIRKAVSILRPGARDLDFSMVQRVIDFAEQPTSTGQTDIGLGLRASLEDQHLLVATWEADLPSAHWPQINDRILISVPGEVDLDNGWLLQAQVQEDGEAAQLMARENQNPYRAWFDFGERQPLLNARPRLPGDRFQPLGMSGKSMKISDFMINHKIPKRARSGWPLVCLGDKVVWVPGYQLAHTYRLMRDSKQVVKLSLNLG